MALLAGSWEIHKGPLPQPAVSKAKLHNISSEGLVTAGCWELVNPWCSLVTLTTHLRERGGVPQDVTLALLAEDRHLVSLGQGLEEADTPAPTMGSSLLQERETYIIIRILSKEGGAPTRCKFLLENLDNLCSELAVPMTWHPMAKWLSWNRSQEAATWIQSGIVVHCQ
ncbi:uncharacterized protein C22orf15 homolog [Dugong dugon]